MLSLNNQDLKIKTAIKYNRKLQKTVVAKVRLLKNWKLKSKFTFTMKNLTVEEQRNYLKDEIINLNGQILMSQKKLEHFPVDLASV